MIDGIQSDQPFKPLEQNCDYVVSSIEKPSDQISLTCINVHKRNWSRVAIGQAPGTQEAEHDKFFLKQYIDRSGLKQHQHWLYEQAGFNVASDLLDGVIKVPALLYQNEAQLLNVFEYVNVITVDELLRNDPVQFNKNITNILKSMVPVLERMQTPGYFMSTSDLPVKQRPYGGPSTAVNFKGFDIRNVGLVSDKGSAHPEQLVMFDFVRPYMAPVEEAAAKLFISIGLLNWGKPLYRFMRGPDTKLLEISREILEPYLEIKSIEAEIALQHRFRTHEYQGSGQLERFIKKSGIDLLGKKYLRDLLRWCKLHVDRRGS